MDHQRAPYTRRDYNAYEIFSTASVGALEKHWVHMRDQVECSLCRHKGKNCTISRKDKQLCHLCKSVWRFLKGLDIEIPFDPEIPLLGIHPKDYKSFYYKDTCTRMFIAALLTIAKTWNQPKCPLTIDWTRKMWHIYSMEYYAVIKNDEFVSFVGTWMNLETIILSKLTQEQKTKHCIYSLIGRQ